MKKIIVGFKSFNSNLINHYGYKYEVKKLYHANNNIKFGINGNGFHICKNLEDTLRFFNSFDHEVEICIVIGFGECDTQYDDYYGYYDMYAFENIYIMKKLSRKEIIDYMKKQNNERIKRFISLYKMNEEEYNMFRNIDSSIDKYIDYYQLNKKDVFEKKYSK